MFTGLIQATGRIAAIERRGRESRLRIEPDFSLADIEDGESIAVNGTCLSVEEHDATSYVAYASAETMQRTNLGFLTQGTLVNLERALRVGDRLGGHIVSGHVDCLATVERMEPRGLSLECRLSFPGEYACEVIAKGSVCLDGISLTVNECGTNHLTVNIIPDTQKRTSLRYWKPGYRVNMETDVLGKYVRRCLLLQPGLQYGSAGDSLSGQSGTSAQSGASASPITLEFLQERGFV